jgi:hypothetical protein
MNTKQRSCIAEPATQPSQPESHHGDLRKCAYLKRRAAYQLQASSGSTVQAGGLPSQGPVTPGSVTTD